VHNCTYPEHLTPTVRDAPARSVGPSTCKRVSSPPVLARMSRPCLAWSLRNPRLDLSLSFRKTILEARMPPCSLLGQPQSERGQRLHDQVKLVEERSGGGLTAPPLHVLVIEDDADLRDVVTLALLDEGYEVVSARDGAEALERIEVYRPDVILLDLDMPVMDGPTFAERYHDLPGLHAPIVVFTAGGQSHRWVERIRAAAYVDKPGDLWTLPGLLRACAGAANSS